MQQFEVRAHPRLAYALDRHRLAVGDTPRLQDNTERPAPQLVLRDIIELVPLRPVPADEAIVVFEELLEREHTVRVEVASRKLAFHPPPHLLFRALRSPHMHLEIH